MTNLGHRRKIETPDETRPPTFAELCQLVWVGSLIVWLAWMWLR